MALLAIAFLVISILITAFAASRKENSLQKLTFSHAVLLFVTFGFLIGGMIMLFIAAGWKWGLFGTITSWLVLYNVAAKAGAPERVEPLMATRVRKVENIKVQHAAQLESFMRSTVPQELVKIEGAFFDDIKQNFPKEFSSLNPESLPDNEMKAILVNIYIAYSVGYMRGKGWITEEDMADFVIHLGDRVAQRIGVTRKSGWDLNAFASGYTVVAVHGNLRAIQVS